VATDAELRSKLVTETLGEVRNWFKPELQSNTNRFFPISRLSCYPIRGRPSVLKHISAVTIVIFAAFSLLAQSTGVTPAQAPQLLQEALEAYRTGRFDSAIEKYQAALQLDANSGDAYAGLARAYLKQEKIEEAFETASKGIVQSHGALPVHTALGEVYFRQGRMSESEKEFLIGANASHPDARACLGLSRLYNAYSLHARARTMLNRAHDLDPGDRDIQRRWIQTLTRKEQIEWLEKYLAGSGNDGDRLRQGLQVRLQLLKERDKRPQQGCHLVSKLKSTETRLEPLLIDPKHLHGFGLIVKINGQSSKLLLDTGASGLLINKKLAQKAGIEPLVTTTVSGIGDKGDASGYVGYADSIKVGDLEFQHCLVEVSDKRSVLDDDGLIGADVFDHYLVTLDFLWWKLKLEELPQRPGEQSAPAILASHQQDEDEADNEPSPDDDHTKAPEGEKKRSDSKAADGGRQPAPNGPQDRYVAPEMQDYTKIFRFGHELLIPTRVGDLPPKLFLIDTGAMMNTISTQAAREVTKVHGDQYMHVRGISGSVKDVYSADKAVLAFSHYRQENQDMTAFDLSGISKGTGTEISGILGFTTLRQFTIKIDYRDGLVDFIYTGPKK
jgi:tetratricopeptide (TPR) repeat protein